MHIVSRLFFVILLLGTLTCCTNGQSQSGVTNLTASDFSEKIKTTKDAQLIDVRTPEEFSGGHLENALNLDWKSSDFQNQMATLDKSKPVLIYCLGGGRSAAAAKKLHEAGFEQVYDLSGGIMAWRTANLPETAKKASSGGMTLAQYEALLKSDKLVLVDFNATWCAPCQKMKPFLEKISKEMADKVTLVKIDADENEALCKALDVSGLPTMKLYKNQQLIWDNLGYVDEATVRKKLQ